MEVLKVLKESIGKVGIKEVSRRTGLSASTVSRVNAGLISPSFDVVKKISEATGYYLELHPESKVTKAPRLKFAQNILGPLRNELKSLGVKHVVIFGSVARGEDTLNSDVDIYLEFSEKPTVTKQLKAEGKVIEAFGETKVDVVSRLDPVKAKKLLEKIEKDGIRVF